MSDQLADLQLVINDQHRLRLSNTGSDECQNEFPSAMRLRSTDSPPGPSQPATGHPQSGQDVLATNANPTQARMLRPFDEWFPQVSVGLFTMPADIGENARIGSDA